MAWLRCVRHLLLLYGLALICGRSDSTSEGAELPFQASGIYPHVDYCKEDGECGTGAVVPWAERLWLITYSPHKPRGSSDKLYSIDRELKLTSHPESVGGTPANRMIHRESRQLFIGPYVISDTGGVRAIGPDSMLGRLTGNARHLNDPAGKIYYATMEEGLYEVDVDTLAVKELYADSHAAEGPRADLPGYHGKGLYSGQGRLVYANNGENSPLARSRPEIPSGGLAEWDGKTGNVVRRNQFTEVTGPGGIEGNANPESDPIWSIGWDHRSLILMLLDGGTWHAYRLPKASHAYDGAHGWNTEWPRIRDIGEANLLMTMHGSFWRFPPSFSAKNSAGIAPRSTYLKVIGDFCRWNDRLVFGCDDTAQNEFLNKRKAKGNLIGPGQSHSNLWFVAPAALDSFGPTLGRGAVWFEEPVAVGEASEPFLFSGFPNRGLHLAHGADTPVEFSLEVDSQGDGRWSLLRKETVPANGYRFLAFGEADSGAWIRLTTDRDAPGVTAMFHYRGEDSRSAEADPLFDALARPGDTEVSGGLVRARGENLRTLQYLAQRPGKEGPVDSGNLELPAEMELRPLDDSASREWLKTNAAIPTDVFAVDAASVLFIDDQGARWRLPKGDAAFDSPGPLGPGRVDREVCTERDLFNCHGTFYELPAENAGGFAKIRPIATHNRRIHDYCSYRGLLVLTGLRDSAAAEDPHVIRGPGGEGALWVGSVDDLWRLGKPRGRGGPWFETPVKVGEPSDPFLMTGYDRKSLTLSHSAAEEVVIDIEVDLTGTGIWRDYESFTVPPGETVEHMFPTAFGAYWLRAIAARACNATVQLHYE